MNFINIYAYSGSNRKKEREEIFLNDLAVHLTKANVEANIVGGDFNCILNGFDCIGESKNYSAGLRQNVDNFGWKDIALELKSLPSGDGIDGDRSSVYIYGSFIFEFF